MTRRPVSPRRAVTTAAAQAPEPQASVTMPPRSQTRIRMVSRSITCDELDVGALREQRVVLDPRRRPRRGRPPRRRAPRRRSAGCPCRPRPGRPSSGSGSSSISRASGTASQSSSRRPHVDPDQPAAGVLGPQHAAPGPELERRRAALVHQHPRDAAGGVAAGVGRACRRRSRSRPPPPPPRPCGSPRAGRSRCRGCGRRARARAPASPAAPPARASITTKSLPSPCIFRNLKSRA